MHYVPGQRFNLQKGDTFEIPTDVVQMGLGWDPCRGPDMDLDASVIMLDRVGNTINTVHACLPACACPPGQCERCIVAAGVFPEFGSTWCAAPWG